MPRKGVARLRGTYTAPEKQYDATDGSPFDI
jgi:hypothetical protein